MLLSLTGGLRANPGWLWDSALSQRNPVWKHLCRSLIKELPSSWMLYISKVLFQERAQSSFRSWLMAELMLVPDLPPARRASVRHHKAISLFINLLGVVMNFIWRIARAPKGHCLDFYFLCLFSSHSNPFLLYFNLSMAQKCIHTVNTIMSWCSYIYSLLCKLRKPWSSTLFWLSGFDNFFTPNISNCCYFHKQIGS